MEWISQAAPTRPGPPVLGDNTAGREVVAASSGPVIAEGGGLPPLPAPKHFSESGLPSGALQRLERTAQ